MEHISTGSFRAGEELQSLSTFTIPWAKKQVRGFQIELPAPCSTHTPPSPSCQNSAACIQSRTETGIWMENIHFCKVLGIQNNTLFFSSQAQIDNAASKWTSVCSSAGDASQGQAGCKGLTIHVPGCASLKAHCNHPLLLQACHLAHFGLDGQIPC